VKVEEGEFRIGMMWIGSSDQAIAHLSWLSALLFDVTKEIPPAEKKGQTDRQSGDRRWRFFVYAFKTCLSCISFLFAETFVTESNLRQMNLQKFSSRVAKVPTLYLPASLLHNRRGNIT